MSTWFAVHLYRSEPWENLLAQTIQPFVERLRERKLIDRFFFVRYWDPAPHLRLRFQTEASRWNQQIKPELESTFSNSLQFAEYQPEIERYGSETISVAEKQFDASSRTVLSILKEANDWNYERALGAAIQLHLAFSFAFKLDSPFFDYLFREWSSLLLDPHVTEAEAWLSRIQNSFEKIYEEHETELIGYAKSLWIEFQEEAEFNQSWMNQWLIDMKEIAGEFTQESWPIVESFIHMTNNRLGIANRDEAYLAFILKRLSESR